MENDRYLVTIWLGDGLYVVDECKDEKSLRNYIYEDNPFAEVHKYKVTQKDMPDFLKNQCNGQRWREKF